MSKNKEDILYNLLKKEYKYENNNIYTDSTIITTQHTNNYESICLTDKLEDLLLKNDENGYVEISKHTAKDLINEINKILNYLEPIIDSMCE